jgi:UDP-glucose 4-epimerase
MGIYLPRDVYGGLSAAVPKSNSPELRERYDDSNLKVNEFLYRRADIEDVVSAHLLAIERAPSMGFKRSISSAT